MNLYIFIGGAYGDDYWQSTTPPDKDLLASWECGELLIIKVDAEFRSWKLISIDGEWGEVRQAAPSRGEGEK